MSDFSIDYILSRAGEKYIGTNASVGYEKYKINTHDHRYVSVNPTHRWNGMELLPQQVQNGGEQLMPVYNWLQYTRYHPPKLPRSLSRTPAKRTPGRLPRIPFSTTQLQALENAYKESNYLSSEDANKLADALDLTSTRVKIWFQNRRARERREKREKDESCDSTFSSNGSSPEPDMISIR